MDETLKEAARQVPSLTVLVVLVIYFLRALDRRDSTIKSIADACHASQASSVNAINENTKVLGMVGEALDAHRQVIADAVRDGIDRSALAKS
ncbi:MAG: hypothetical protein K8T90_08975 [Planctomycetes bacterium]|nr:hypothetical protein [Planctomycetota bacterium]